MPIVVDPTYGPKPAMQLLGGSPSSLATPSVPFLPNGRSVTLGGGGLRTVSYDAIYRSQPWIGRACRLMAEAIARLPLQMFGYTDALQDTRQRDRTHAAAQLLSRPRPGRRGFHLRWDMALSLYVHGNYVAWKRRASRGAPPYELWTLDWRTLIPIMAGGRVLGWEWRGEGVPGLQPGDIVLIENTLHLAFGAPGGGDIGVSPLEQLGVTIRSEDSLQRYAEAAMRNGTRFGVAVILDKSVKADKVRRDGVREELMDAHGGVDQAFKPAVLGGGITDIKPLGEQTAVDAELINQRKLNREESAAVIGVPAPVLGILDEAKYSSIKEIHRMLYVTALGGPLGLLAESTQAQLLDSEPAWDANDRFVEFSLDEVLKGDAKERWETYAVALGSGGLTLNDVRRKENLPPYDDPRADEPLIAANNVRPLSAIGVASTETPGQAIDRVVNGHVERAFARAAAGAEAGQAPRDAIDRPFLEGELAAELKGLGLNGSSAPLARHVAEEIEHFLADAASTEDVLAAAHAYTAGAAE